MDWPLLAPLSEEERAAVMAAARPRRFVKGEVLFHEGDPAEALHLVTEGHVAVRVSTPDGDRAMLNVLGPGAHVGELALLGDQHRTATVVALDAVATRVLTGSAFRAVCEHHPAVQVLLTALLVWRVRDLSTRLLETMYVGLDRRLYRMLLELDDLYARDADSVIPLTQEQLAELVGGTRPSVNQVLQRLSDQGVIALGRGRITVLDVEALRRKAGLR